MAHNLEIRNGKASIAFAGETPWHRLGQKIQSAFDAQTALTEAGLNFVVEKTPIAVADTGTVIENKFAVRRTDTKAVLGVVGNSYTPLQNAEAFAFFDGVFGKDTARYECAGVLGQGERIWLLAKLPGDFRIIGDDVIGKYLLLTNGHDGSEAVRARFTPIRVVCQNTLNAALRERSKEIFVMHHADVKERLAMAGKLLAAAGVYFNEAQETFRAFASFKLDTNGRRDFWIAAVSETPRRYDDLGKGARNRIDDIEKLHETGRGTEISGVRGTLWGAYNALTEWIDHQRTTDSLDYMAVGAGAVAKGRALEKAKAILSGAN